MKIKRVDNLIKSAENFNTIWSFKKIIFGKTLNQIYARTQKRQ